MTERPAHLDLSIDTFGLLCPMPIIKTAEALKSLEVGSVIEVIATDPGASQDLRDWCKANRQDYIGDDVHGRIHRIWIKKTEAGAR